MTWPFDNSYARLPERFYRRVLPTPVPRPALLALNAPLAVQLGLDPETLASSQGLDILCGNSLPPGADAMALAYAGHQFGHLVPQLGDGRAVLLGELVGSDGERRDVQLKGSGRTPFSRGGDGRAALGPVLREYILSEAMAALGVPTTRALAAVTTGMAVFREMPLPGAVLTRVAASHLRIGTFQYFAMREDGEALALLTDYALRRHYPDVDQKGGPALALLDAVMAAQAQLVARWMGIGFIHGVMNTDNTTISGETLDYGPCAFMDGFDPQRTFSSIDHGGRYAYANQPQMAQWNLSRLAEALLPLVHDDQDRAVAILTERLAAFAGLFDAAYRAVLNAKLGLLPSPDAQTALADQRLADQLFGLMAAERVDFTRCFSFLTAGLRSLTEGLRSTTEATDGADAGMLALFAEPAAVSAWLQEWHARRALQLDGPAQQVARMRQANPVFVPRNHRVEEVIAAATQGDLGPLQRLLRVLARPHDQQAQDADLADPPDETQWQYQTFCGT